ncbi:MAG: COQ9 family protein [Pseudomonadota bacterium]|jgi:ubiquinone biosynthesis protein COQ9|nr:COQ9 family protein [Pseudomonadota bacterium]
MTDAASDTRSRQYSTRDALLQPMLAHAAFDGWTADSFRAACEDAGIEEGLARLACPRGELDLIAHWSRKLDAAVLDAVKAANLAEMKIRDRVRFGVMARLEALNGHEEAARRARARLLLPDAAAEGPQLLWATADTIWRAIGDTSTDVNFYTKRTILSGVYGSTLSAWLNESDAEKPDAQAFLDRRIQNVMDFEKTKAQLKKMTADLPDIAGVLGKMRYGPGPRV